MIKLTVVADMKPMWFSPDHIARISECKRGSPNFSNVLTSNGTVWNVTETAKYIIEMIEKWNL